MRAGEGRWLRVSFAAAFVLMVGAAPAVGSEQRGMFVGTIPNADGLLLSFWEVPERVVAYDGAVECRYVAETNGQEWTHTISLESGLHGVDLGAFCLISAAEAFPELSWPSATGVRIEGSIHTAELVEPAFGTTVTLGADQLSSRAAVMATLAGFGEVLVGEASQDYELDAIAGPSYAFQVTITPPDGGVIEAFVQEGVFGASPPVVGCVGPDMMGGPGCTVVGATHSVLFQIGGRDDYEALSQRLVEALRPAVGAPSAAEN